MHTLRLQNFRLKREFAGQSVKYPPSLVENIYTAINQTILAIFFFLKCNNHIAAQSNISITGEMPHRLQSNGY